MKRKGFTLVELLAVIVILAVIALIATPMILGVIETARKGAAVESANGLMDAAEKYTIQSMLTGSTVTRFDFPGDTNLQYKGEKPESGTLIVDKDGKMSISVKVNGYCIRKRFNETSPVVVEEETCEIEPSELAYAENYRESMLNGADPVISGDLIPVIIEEDGTVKKADTKTKWYSYENKIWANAIILKDGATVELDGSIKEENIKQYYVWIPRYRYQLWNVNGEELYPNGTEGPSAINIVFESKQTTASLGDENGEWLTHPAFTSFDTNGIWVGKFETSYDEETYTNSSLFATSNPNYVAALSSSNILIKPNVRSLTNKSVSEFYTLSRGIDANLNSHMIKNSEWGAVAYLTYSNYGKCTSEGCEEVVLNNINTGYYGGTALFTEQWESSASITGCSASTVNATVNSNQSTCASGYAWNEENNKASTTGNISGIYDMAGGNFETVMGVLEYEATGIPVSGRNAIYNSGFNGMYSAPTTDSQTELENTDGITFPNDSRYYDLYHYNYEMGGTGTNIWYDYSTGHLGDATKEIAVSKVDAPNGDRGLWFSDYAGFLTATGPWFIRGGNFWSTSSAGVFYFARNTGRRTNDVSSRIILAF